MVRIDVLHRCGNTLTIDFMGYIGNKEFEVLYDFLKECAEDGITEVRIVSNEVRAYRPWMEKDIISMKKLGLKLRFQQAPFFLKHALRVWGLEDCIDD